ncbi:MAG TPA: FAD-dependent oxidoreductase [Chitinophagaceae bacterium]|nr:FAD-dependent oxidoreductase [Chitinophagaceae bacterium]
MNLRAGYPFGLVKNGLPFDYPKLEKDIKTEVLIMGGGISGALAAHYLIREGIECAVVDARSIGLGSTCASTSLLQYEIDVPLHKLISLIGNNNAIKAYTLCEQAIFRLKTLAEEVGLKKFSLKKSLYYAAHKKDIPFLQHEYEARKKAGFKVKYIDGKNMFDEFGFTAPGTILSDTAAVTDAYLLTHYLFQYNMKRGLTVYDRTPVISIQHHAKDVRLKIKNGHTITAGKLVYATGYEVLNYIHEPIVKLHSTYAVISESFSEAPRFGKYDGVIWNTADPYLYLRTTADRRIIIGGRDEIFFSPGKRDKLITAKARQLKKDFNKLFPDKPFNTEFSWTGIFGSTKDGLPFIGPYKPLPNSYFALGFGGNGITFSQVAGEIIADLLKKKRNKNVSIFSFERI